MFLALFICGMNGARHPAYAEAAEVRIQANALLHLLVLLIIHLLGLFRLTVGTDPATFIAQRRKLRTQPLSAWAGAFPVSA